MIGLAPVQVSQEAKWLAMVTGRHCSSLLEQYGIARAARLAVHTTKEPKPTDFKYAGMVSIFIITPPNQTTATMLPRVRARAYVYVYVHAYTHARARALPNLAPSYDTANAGEMRGFAKHAGESWTFLGNNTPESPESNCKHTCTCTCTRSRARALAIGLHKELGSTWEMAKFHAKRGDGKLAMPSPLSSPATWN